MHFRQLLQLVILAAIWGASFLFMTVSVPEFGAVLLITVRLVLAAMVLLPIWWFRQGPEEWPKIKQTLPALLLIALFNSAIPFVLFAFSLLYITGGLAAIFNSTAPIWGAVVAFVWLGVKPSKGAVLGLLIGVAGVVILVGGEILNPSSDSTQWQAVLAVAIAPVLYGVAANVTSTKCQHLSALSITSFSQLLASLCLIPVSFLFLPNRLPSLEAWAACIVLAVVCTAIAYLMYFGLIRSVGATKAISVTFLIPVFGTLWGALFLAERVTANMLLGMSIILLGTALVTGVLSGLNKHRR